MIDTSESLLDRLKVDDAQDAWKEFYHLYWGAILRYGRKLGLNQHQSEEVLQETMVTLMRLLPTFAYDRNKGRFRNFLLTIVHRKALAAHRRKARTQEVEWDEADAGHSTSPFPNETSLEKEAILRWQEALVEEAIRRVRESGRLDEHTYAVFEAYAIQRRPVEDVAREFGMKENVVYQIRYRILQRVQAEVELLKKNSRSQ